VLIWFGILVILAGRINKVGLIGWIVDKVRRCRMFQLFCFTRFTFFPQEGSDFLNVFKVFTGVKYLYVYY